MAPPLPVQAGTHGLLAEVCVVECAAFQPHAPSHLDVRQNTPTLLPSLTPFYPIHEDAIVSEQVILV